MVFVRRIIEQIFFKPTEKALFEMAILGIQDKMIWLEETFWDKFWDVFKDIKLTIELIDSQKF